MRKAMQGLFRGVAIVAALLASLQPVLGAFAFARRGDGVNYESLHLVVGGIIYILAILLAILALVTRFRRRWLLLGLSVALYGLTHLQLRLGLGTNEDASLLAYHIPVGVLIVLLAYAIAALGFGAGFEPSQT